MVALPPGEVLMPTLATGMGVVAAAVFIIWGGGNGADASYDQDDAPPVDGKAEDGDGGPAGATAPAPRRRRLTPEREAEIRKRMEQLTPEARKALDDWVSLRGDDRWAVLAMNCLVLTLFMGGFFLFAAYLIGAHGINILELQTWRRGAAMVGGMMRDAQNAKGGDASAREMEL
mmetsp:Transcript_99184/g.296445  ORF Transcript_99184/g.296445 Transcript_99184/m.296445 type:complete len:174 (-) Transcript_99184:57-578(-)